MLAKTKSFNKGTSKKVHHSRAKKTTLKKHVKTAKKSKTAKTAKTAKKSKTAKTVKTVKTSKTAKKSKTAKTVKKSKTAMMMSKLKKAKKTKKAASKKKRVVGGGVLNTLFKGSKGSNIAGKSAGVGNVEAEKNKFLSSYRQAQEKAEELMQSKTGKSMASGQLKNSQSINNAAFALAQENKKKANTAFNVAKINKGKTNAALALAIQNADYYAKTAQNAALRQQAYRNAAKAISEMYAQNQGAKNQSNGKVKLAETTF